VNGGRPGTLNRGVAAGLRRRKGHGLLGRARLGGRLGASLASVALIGLAASAPSLAAPAPGGADDDAPIRSTPERLETEVLRPEPEGDGADEPPAPPDPLAAAVRAQLEAERYGSGVVLCEEARRAAGGDVTELTAAARMACGEALLYLGDRLYAIGSESGARQRWEQAAAIDPRLLDDADFLFRMTRGRPPAAYEIPPRRREPPSGGVEADGRDEVREHLPPPGAPPGEASAEVEADDDVLDTLPPAPGPRARRGLGLGVSGGFDGVAGLLVSWMAQEVLAVEVSVGLIYPVVDTRARWYGLRAPVSPILGLGITIPLGREDRFGFELPGYDALYELGDSIHVDIGVAWAATANLELLVAIAFVTPIDQGHLDTVIFFPQLAGQVVYYF